MRDGRRSMGRRRLLGAVLAAGLAVSTAAACGGGDDSGSGDGALKGQKLTVAAIWTGSNEGAKFQKVLDEFEKRTGAEVTYTPTGDNVAAYLGSKVEGNAPPDVAFLPQQGVLVEFAEKGWIKPLPDEAKSLVQQNFAKVWQDLGSHEGTVYGVYFKASSKSTVWYRKQAFADAGITTPPASWDDFVKTAQTLSDAGTTPISVGAADGWVLTDWFENVYLSVAGPEKYDQLSKHEIKYTDPTVKEALRKLAEIWGKDSYLAGGAKGALQTEFPASVPAVFGDEPKAAMLPGADFVASEITSATNSKVGTDADFFPFPAAGSTTPVVGAGDVAVMMKDTPAARELMKFLATPEAAKVWAEQGGFISPNKALDLSVYPDEVQRRIAKAVIDAGDAFRFDMSDLAPAAFGGTKGSGEWKILQDFLADPDDVDGTAEKLEKAAAAAFKS
ncbi:MULTISPECIES: ABC transporter substrate-binding protein [Thermomonospora]|uniref:Extracellular solute-binding protein family 1 n=1 Tax=Thermomonospora curvata (strain ATCC 19995 / DSM 43183 / JCM 3096 / KCTC 9072 / NBRC 15933 / NCIMB 10081 / Henssen B9) TaxID=471852 RepID=D1A2U3_THECD|nr:MULTISPECIES: ABC transporter substrate-binding protein [Thermomonospora]ACY97891.1 extracellular solute-binding protein family 1 [Thermomonospora curvata DSM 43183]PKK14172.1 MAG: carbohydrate ABC transporter substrate-binding protein [Thermomonospora sp. CIF 1]